MADEQPSNNELPLSAVVFTIFLCVIFGSNAVAVKITFMGMGVFTTAAIRFGIAAVAMDCAIATCAISINANPYSIPATEPAAIRDASQVLTQKFN